MQKIKIILILVVFLSFTKNVDAAFRMPPNSLGLVGYWAMNDATGTKATDYSGNGNTGTLTNFALTGSTSNWITGKRGGALNFDGTDDYVDFGTSNSLNLSTGGTVSLWFKRTGNPVVGTYHALFQRFGAGVTGYQLYLNPSNVFGFYTNSVLASSYTLADDNWHHYVATNNGTTTFFYVDGVALGSGAQSMVDITSPTTTYIGRYASSGYANGSMDEVRIYNRALTGTEVTALYNSGVTKLSQGSANGLVGHWKLDDASGNKASDSSGSGNTGTITNATWAAGKRGGALNFDGAGDYVTSASSTGITGTGTRTMSFWLKLNAVTDSTMVGFGTASASNWFYALVYSGNWYLSGHSNDWNTGVAATTGVWQHHVITYDGTIARWYIDGAQLGSGNTMALNTLSGVVYMGLRGALADFPLNGSLDDIRIYNRALGVSEVTTLYNSGAAKLNASTAGRGGNLTSGLVGHWTFDGSKLSTTTATDSGSGGNNGTLTNGPVPVQGKLGQALSLDGTNDHVLVSSSSLAPGPTSSFTLSAWAKPNTLGGGRKSVVGNTFNCGATEFDAHIGFPYDGTSKWSLEAGKSCVVSGSAVSTADAVVGKWDHIVGVFKNGSADLYVNGVYQSTQTYSATINTANPPAAPGWYLGYGGTGGNYVNGSIDDVRIYNRELSAAEVLQLYNLR